MATLGNTTATSLEVLGNAKAATFTGNLTGNVTGNASTATSATQIQGNAVTFKDLVITKSDGTTTTYKLVCKS